MEILATLAMLAGQIEDHNMLLNYSEKNFIKYFRLLECEVSFSLHQVTKQLGVHKQASSDRFPVELETFKLLDESNEDEVLRF